MPTGTLWSDVRRIELGFGDPNFIALNPMTNPGINPIVVAERSTVANSDGDFLIDSYGVYTVTSAATGELFVTYEGGTPGGILGTVNHNVEIYRQDLITHTQDAFIHDLRNLINNPWESIHQFKTISDLVSFINDNQASSGAFIRSLGAVTDQLGLQNLITNAAAWRSAVGTQESLGTSSTGNAAEFLNEQGNFVAPPTNTGPQGDQGIGIFTVSGTTNPTPGQNTTITVNLTDPSGDTTPSPQTFIVPPGAQGLPGMDGSGGEGDAGFPIVFDFPTTPTDGDIVTLIRPPLIDVASSNAITTFNSTNYNIARATGGAFFIGLPDGIDIDTTNNTIDGESVISIWWNNAGTFEPLFSDATPLTNSAVEMIQASTSDNDVSPIEEVGGINANYPTFSGSNGAIRVTINGASVGTQAAKINAIAADTDTGRNISYFTSSQIRIYLGSVTSIADVSNSINHYRYSGNDSMWYGARFANDTVTATETGSGNFDRLTSAVRPTRGTTALAGFGSSVLTFLDPDNANGTRYLFRRTDGTIVWSRDEMDPTGNNIIYTL